MADPLTLSVLSATALTEGIKFLYGQATELLKRRHERSSEVPATPPVEGRLEPLSPDPGVLESLTPDLRELRRLLADYADEVEPADPADRLLLERVDALRLVAVYGQRITFRGEHRPASGPVVQGAIDVRSVSSYAAAVRAEVVRGSADVRGKARADEVRAGGEIVGVDIDRIGER